MNIRYPLYEGVYRILTEKRTKGEKNGRTEGEKDKRTEEQKSGKGRGFG